MNWEMIYFWTMRVLQIVGVIAGITVTLASVVNFFEDKFEADNESEDTSSKYAQQDYRRLEMLKKRQMLNQGFLDAQQQLLHELQQRQR